MAAKYRVLHEEIAVGRPLKWDVYDSAGILLLRRGNTIDSQRALDRLIEDGLFLSGEDSVAQNDAQAAPEPDQPSAVQFLLDARRALVPSASGSAGRRSFDRQMLHTAGLVDRACRSNRNVALASVQLMQDGSYAVRHHINTAIVANLLAREMSADESQVLKITAAALTMNVSMLDVHDKLNEIRTPLNDKLRTLIQRHPAQSVQRLRELGVNDEFWIACVEQHHERDDGSGYPHGLSGGDMLPGARIIGLADRYCARISIRKYKPTQPPNIVLRDLYIENGREIDTLVAANLLRVVGLYPPGTIVRLRNGEVAVVTEPTENPDAPIAYAVLGASGAALAVPTLRKTAREAFNIIDVIAIDKVDFPIQMSRLWGDAARAH